MTATAAGQRQSSDARVLSGLNALRVIDRPQATAGDVAEALEADSDLCQRLLRMARSPLYGVHSDDLTVGRAVVLLGFASVRKAVVLHFCRAIAATGEPGMDERWVKALWRGIAAEQIALRLRQELVSEAFMSGIMRSFSRDIEARAVGTTAPDDPTTRLQLDKIVNAAEAVADQIIGSLPALPTTATMDQCLLSAGLGRLEDGRLAVDIRRGFDLYATLFD